MAKYKRVFGIREKLRSSHIRMAINNNVSGVDFSRNTKPYNVRPLTSYVRGIMRNISVQKLKIAYSVEYAYIVKS